MAWLSVDQSLPDHRKTLRAADILSVSPVQIVGHMVCFWLWALDNAPDGDLGDVTPGMIARAAQWDGDPQLFTDALSEARFLESEGDPRIRNWEEYGGKLIEGKRKSRERAKRSEERRKAKEQVTEMPDESTRNLRADNAQTAEQKRKEKKRKEDKDIKPSSSSGDDESSSSSPQKDIDLEEFLSKAFPVFWQEYPRKVGKREAEKAFRAQFKKCPKAKRADLMKGIADHLYDYIDTIEAKGTAMEYVKHPATWLRAIDFFEPPVKEAL